jgi:hypothetical protein
VSWNSKLGFGSALALCLMAQVASEHGRQLFHGERPLAARLANGSDPLPPSATACSNCHGRFGQGGREAGVDVASLSWRRLVRQEHYDEVSFCEALKVGTSPSGTVLSVAMPRYTVETAGCRDLWAYLQDVEQAAIHGASADAIRIALLAPPHPSPAGAQVFEQTFEAVNKRGGIWGRRLEFVVASVAPANASVLIYLQGKPLTVDVRKRLVIVWQDEAPELDKFVVSASLTVQAKSAIGLLPKGTHLFTGGRQSLWEDAWREAADETGYSHSGWDQAESVCRTNRSGIAIAVQHIDAIPAQLLQQCSTGAVFFREGDSSRLGPLWRAYRLRPRPLDATVATDLVETVIKTLDAVGRKLILRDIQDRLSSEWRARSGDANRLLQGVFLEVPQGPGTWRRLPSDVGVDRSQLDLPADRREK